MTVDSLRHCGVFRVTAFLTLLVFAVGSFLPPSVQGQSTSAALLQPTAAFEPAALKGLVRDPLNPLTFDFVFSRGSKHLDDAGLREEAEQSLGYFLAALTVPEEDMWVNLSPKDSDRVIPDGLGRTALGRDLLELDLTLKKLSSSFLHPETAEGKKFWNQVYARSRERFGTTDVPVDMFNRIWIVPDTAVIYQHKQSAFLAARHLKVMLECDYLAERGEMTETEDALSADQRQIMREVVIPVIEQEVNQGQHFARLRQIYNAMILAFWLKQNLKRSVLGSVYADKNRTEGIEHGDAAFKDRLYNQYLESVRKGLYDFIQVETDFADEEPLPRRYFSGGIVAPKITVIESPSELAAVPSQAALGRPSEDDAMITVKLDAVASGPAAQTPRAADTRAFGRTMTVFQQASDDLYRFEAAAGTIMRGRKISKNAMEVMFLYSLELLSEFARRMNDRDFVFQKILEESARQPLEIQQRRLPEIMGAVAYLYQDASPEEKERAFGHLRALFAQQIRNQSNLDITARALDGLARALGTLFANSPLREKNRAFAFLQQDVRSFIDEKMPLMPQERRKARQEKFQQLRAMSLTGILKGTAILFGQASAAELAESRGRLQEALDEANQLGIEHRQGAIDAVLRSLLELHQSVSLAEQDALDDMLSPRLVSLPSASRQSYLESLAEMYARSGGETRAVIERIRSRALAAAVKLEDEKARSIAVSRIAGGMVKVVNAADGEAAEQKEVVHLAIEEVRSIVQNSNDPRFIQQAKPRLELTAKLMRAQAMLHLAVSNREQRLSELETIKEEALKPLSRLQADPDAMSRLLAGAAESLAEVYRDAPDEEKLTALKFLEEELVPRIQSIAPVTTLDETKQRTEDYMGRVRAVSRMAQAVSVLFAGASPEISRQHAIPMVRNKLLPLALQYSRLNGQYLDRLMGMYRSLNALVWRTEKVEDFSWQRLVEAESNYDLLVRHGQDLTGAESANFHISLGAFGSRDLVVRLLRDPEIPADAKAAVIHGRLFFHKTFPLQPDLTVLKPLSNEELEHYADRIAGDVLTTEDQLKFVEQTAVQPNLSSWGEIAELLSYAARDPGAHLHFLRHLLVVLRVKSHRGESAVRGVNIEEIPRMVLPALIKIFEDDRAVEYLYPELRALLRALPLDSFLINEIRIRIYTLFDEKLVPVQAEFQNVIRLIFHDSPSPYHLEIIRAYARYLDTGEDADREALDRLMAPFQEGRAESIKVPPDYIQRLGSDVERMRQAAAEARDLYEDLYGEQQAKAIVRTLLDRKAGDLLPPAIASSIKGVLNQMSRIQLGDTIPTNLRKFYRTFPVSQFTPGEQVALAEQITNVRQQIHDVIQSPQTSGQARVYLLRLQNSIEPLLFSLLNSLRGKWRECDSQQRRRAVLSGLQAVMQDLAPQSQEFKELALIRREMELAPRMPALREFAVLTRVERVLNRAADALGQKYQSRVESYAATIDFRHRAVREFAADMVRESVLFSFSLMLEEAIDEQAAANSISRWNITRPGKTAGRLVYIENPEDPMAFANLKGDEILVMDYLSPSQDFPRVRGLITGQGATSLSHLAIHAGQHGTPWASPRRRDYEAYRDLARQMGSGDTQTVNNFVYTVSESGVRLDQSLTREQLATAGGRGTAPKRDYAPRLVTVTQNVLRPEAYEIGNVGAKAFKIGGLSRLFPGRVPAHATVPFSMFDRLMANDAEFQSLRERLSQAQDLTEISGILDQLRARILQTEIPASVQAEIEDALRAAGILDSDRVIARSSSSVEDGDVSPGAGVYESVVNQDRRRLGQDILRVFASLYSRKAYFERLHDQFEEPLAKMNVLLQKLEQIQAPALQYGFVIHTRNPHSTDPDELLIELAAGLGEALVSGSLEFAGDAHQFSFNRRTGKVQRLRYANKSYQLLPNGDVVPVNYADDPLSQEDIPFGEHLAGIFRDSLTVEKDPELGRQRPQDIEGVLVLEEMVPRHAYVQTRPQAGIEELDRRSREAGETMAAKVVIPEARTASRPLDSNPPVFHDNLLSQSAYDLPVEMFGGRPGTNLVALWREAFEAVLGRGQVLVTPIGSLSYMFEGNAARWQDIGDFDFNFYLTHAATEARAWQIERNALPAVKAKFVELAAAAGLTVRAHADGRIELTAKINGEERVFEMKDVNLRFLPLNKITSGRIEQREPDGYLFWYGYYGDAEAVSRLDHLLATERQLTPGQIRQNTDLQYRFAYERGRSEQEGDDYRKLKEIVRLAFVVGDEGLKREALDVLNQFNPSSAAGLAPTVRALWERLPIPGSSELQARIAVAVQLSEEHARAVVKDVQQSLETQRILPGENVFFSFFMTGSSERMVSSMADAVFLAHLQSGRFFFVDWTFSRHRAEVAKRLVARLRQAYPARSVEELGVEAEVIMDQRVINFVHYYDPQMMEQWFSRYPRLREQSDVSHLDFILAWLKDGHRLTPDDTLLIQHIDHGSLFGLLTLLISKGNYDEKLLDLLAQTSTIQEKVVGTAEYVDRRARGDLVPAQKLAFTLDALIKALKDQARQGDMTRVLAGAGVAEKSVLGRLRSAALNLYRAGEDRGHEKAYAGRMTILQSQAKRMHQSLRGSRPLGERSPSGKVFAIAAGREGVSDPDVIYAIAGKEARVAVTYEEVKSQGQVVGWRYLAVGRSPLHPRMKLAALVPVLENLESRVHEGRQHVRDTAKAAMWRGRANKEVVLVGPNGIDMQKQDFSYIPPAVLLELLESYVEQFERSQDLAPQGDLSDRLGVSDLVARAASGDKAQVGGINLDARLLSLSLQGEMETSWPVVDLTAGALPVKGFVPRIIQIRPVFDPAAVFGLPDQTAK